MVYGPTKKTDGTTLNIGDVAADVQTFVTRDTGATLVAEGRMFVAGFRNAAATGGDVVSLQIVNPAGSGEVASVHRISAFTSHAEALMVTFKQGATSTGGLLTPFNINMASTKTPASSIKAGTNVLTGGTAIPAYAHVTSRDAYEFADGMIIIPPGKSVSCEVTVPSALTGSYGVDINAFFSI